MSTKRDDERFLFRRQHRGSRDLRSHPSILETRALPPLRHGLRVNAVAFAQRLERSFRSLYCCSDGVSGRGASVKYLSHSVSLIVRSMVPPSHCGTKHLMDDKKVPTGTLSAWSDPSACRRLFDRAVSHCVDVSALRQWRRCAWIPSEPVTCPVRDWRRSSRRACGPQSTTHRRPWRPLLNVPP